MREAAAKHMDIEQQQAELLAELREGGLCPAESVHTGGPLVILFSSDLEATHAAVKAAGGAITTETFSFPGGRRFHFADPAGNELAVWTQ